LSAADLLSPPTSHALSLSLRTALKGLLLSYSRRAIELYAGRHSVPSECSESLPLGQGLKNGFNYCMITVTFLFELQIRIFTVDFIPLCFL
jgi:hypothetical protein